MKLEQMESKTKANQMSHSEIVSETEWLVARKDLLSREKEFTRQRDALSAARRKLPWVKIDKEYIFDGPDGKETLADLFEGRSQLIVYHFMFGPGWEEGCKSCSYLADHFDGANWHLPHRDVTFVVVWAGASNGCHRTGATSISTITSRSRRTTRRRTKFITTTEWESSSAMNFPA